MTNFVDVDVRPILRAGGEPFAEIMRAVAALKPGEGLRLFATFKPVPLLSVLGSKGFSHRATELTGGDWEVLFTPSQARAADADADAGTSRTADDGKDDIAWPQPAHELDNRDLEPPEPMVRILAATEKMAPGEVLSALLCREPIFLLRELAKRGHGWRGNFEPDGKTYKVLIRVGPSRGAAS
jgi:TusA-related sulfurtransferase